MQNNGLLGCFEGFVPIIVYLLLGFRMCYWVMTQGLNSQASVSSSQQHALWRRSLK